MTDARETLNIQKTLNIDPPPFGHFYLGDYLEPAVISTVNPSGKTVYQVHPMRRNAPEECEKLFRAKLAEYHTFIMRFPQREPQLVLLAMDIPLRNETQGEFLPRTGSVDAFKKAWDAAHEKLDALHEAMTNAQAEYDLMQRTKS